MKLTIRNDQARLITFSIQDRPAEVHTTSVGAPPDTVPPKSTLSFYLREGDMLVLTQDGGLRIEPGAETS